MTVQQLIDNLKQYPADTEVFRWEQEQDRDGPQSFSCKVEVYPTLDNEDELVLVIDSKPRRVDPNASFYRY